MEDFTNVTKQDYMDMAQNWTDTYVKNNNNNNPTTFQFDNITYDKEDDTPALETCSNK